jgi:hypothetical protein
LGNFDIVITGTTIPTVGEWYHVAICKVGNDYGLYVNGVQEAGTTDSTSYDFSGELIIGRGHLADKYFDGLIDEIRIQTSNIFSANPSLGNDTITVPTSAHVADANTKLLMHFDEDLFVDSSNVGHSVNIVSNAQVVVPKFGTGNAFFNGTTQYLTIPDHSGFDFGSGDFTIEAFVKFTSLGNWTALFNKASSVAVADRQFQIGTQGTNGIITARVYENSNVYVINGPTVLNTGVWYHIAFIRNGNDLKLYLDGVQEGSTVDVTGVTVNNIPTDLEISYDSSGGFIDKFDGQMDEVRISNIARTIPVGGPVSAYTTDANTKLLMHFDGDLLDSSDIGHDVTVVNTTAIASPKFGAGNLRLNGTNQYLTIPDSPDWDIGATTTQDYTIDFWVKHNDYTSPVTQMYITHVQDGSNRWIIDHNTSTNGIRFIAIEGGININTGWQGVLADNNWHHIALIKVGNDWAVYLDGARISSFANHTDVFDFTGNLYIGQDSFNADFLNGNLDELRIQKSNIFSADPTTANSITVPTSAFTPDVNTALLLHFDTDPIVDSGLTGHTVTNVNNAELTYSKFGEGSSYFDGVGDYLTMPDSPDWDIFATNTEEWTVDFWVRLEKLVGDNVLISQRVDSNNRWNIQYTTNAGTGFRFLVRSGGTTIINSTANGEISDTDWHHISFIKKADEYAFYLDGVQVLYVQNAATANFAAPLFIGGESSLSASAFTKGNIEELRFQKSNYFNANPVVGLTDTIVVPTEAYSPSGRIIRSQGIIIT